MSIYTRNHRPTAYYGETWRHPQNRKHITYRHAAAEWPNHGCRGHAQKISYRWVKPFQRYASGKTHTSLHLDLSRYCPKCDLGKRNLNVLILGTLRQLHLCSSNRSKAITIWPKSAHATHYGETWRDQQNRKYITYRHAAIGCPSHVPEGHVQKIREDWSSRPRDVPQVETMAIRRRVGSKFQSKMVQN